MQLTIGLKRFSCYFFISTLLLSTLQITVAGYEADENAWFSILTTLLAEEENEDSEVEEESKCPQEYTAHINHITISDSNEYFRSLEANQLYLSVLRKVFSPPPEFCTVLA